MLFLVQNQDGQIVFHFQDENGYKIEKIDATDLYTMLPRRRAELLVTLMAGDKMSDVMLLKHEAGLVQADAQILTIHQLHDLTLKEYRLADERQKNHENTLMMTLTLVIVAPILYMLLDTVVLRHFGLSILDSEIGAFGILAVVYLAWFIMTYTKLGERIEEWVMIHLAQIRRTGEQ
ncbi:hypothetical protein ACDP95_04605 [Weissella confusa]